MTPPTLLILRVVNRRHDLTTLLIDALRLPGASRLSADELIVPSLAMQRAMGLQLARQ